MSAAGSPVTVGRRAAQLYAFVAGVFCVGLMVYAWQQPVPEPLLAPFDRPMVLFGILSGFLALSAAMGLLLTRPDRAATPDVVLARLDDRLHSSWYLSQALFAGAWGVIYGTGMFAIVVVIRDPAPFESLATSVFVLLLGVGGICAAALVFVVDVLPRAVWTWHVLRQGVHISELDVESTEPHYKHGQLTVTRVDVLLPDGAKSTLHLQDDHPPLFGLRADVQTVFVATPRNRPSHFQVISTDGSPFWIHPE